MPEWWTYSLADFLMFSPSVYFRLFELENQRLWPYQFVAILCGIALAATIMRASARSQRAALVLLAAAWLACAWTYFWRSYATIHTYAHTFAIVFAVQAAGLLLQAALSTRSTAPSPPAGRIGLGLFLFALLLQPLTALAFGRPLAQAEWFALMPDPTVLATLGVLIALPRIGAWLFAIPLLWSLYSGLTLYALGSGAAWLAFMQAAVALVAPIALRTRRPDLRA